MASALIASKRTVSGNQPQIRRLPEEALQTFLDGTPVQIAAGDGGVQAWDGVTVAAGIAGFAKEIASNLAATGIQPTFVVGSAVGASTIGAVKASLGAGTRADVPNQPAARTIFRGAPYNDTRVGFEVANSDTVFYGQVGPLQTTLASDVGKQYGLTKDTDGHWYIDKTKVGGSAVLTVVKQDPIDVARGLHFQVNLAAQQLSPA
jgi:hypothetical protein